MYSRPRGNRDSDSSLERRWRDVLISIILMFLGIFAFDMSFLSVDGLIIRPKSAL